MRWTRGRTYAVVGLVAMAGVAVAVVPALGNDHPDAVRLHMSASGQYFEYDGSIQPITSKNCVIEDPAAADPDAQPPIARLMDLDSTANNANPGYKDNSIGIKTGGSQGVPCSRVSLGEPELVLTVPASGPLAGREFDGMRLDLELKSNAWVVAEMRDAAGAVVATHELVSGSSIADAGELLPDAPVQKNPDGFYIASTGPGDEIAPCASPSDSGPDSGPNDNCLWTIEAGGSFTSVHIWAHTGEFSLEGGGDYPIAGYDTLFYLSNADPTADPVTATTDENTSVPIDVSSDIGDPDGDTLTVTVEPKKDSDGVVLTKGTISVSGLVITFDPDDKFETLNVGEWEDDSFYYTVSDGKGGTATNTVIVRVTGVNDAPIVDATTTFQMPEDPGEPKEGEDDPRILTIATDIDDEVIFVSCEIPMIELVDVYGDPVLEDDEQVYVPIGTYVDNQNGTITFTPLADYNTGTGTVTFDCTAEDPGGKTDTKAITLQVTPVDDDPVAVDDVAYADDDERIQIDVLANDYDVDNVDETLTIELASSLPAGFTITENDVVVTFESDSLDWIGPVSFQYRVTDSTNRDSDWATVTVYELLRCGESLTVEDEDTGATATYERLGDGGCDGKPYEVDILHDAGDPVVFFQPRPTEGDPVVDCSATPDECLDEFLGELSFGVEGERNAPDTGGKLVYDPVVRESMSDAVYRDMPWCEFDPSSPPTGSERREALPANHSWCIVSVQVDIADPNNTRTTWYVYGIGDPFKRLS